MSKVKIEKNQYALAVVLFPFTAGLKKSGGLRLVALALAMVSN